MIQDRSQSDFLKDQSQVKPQQDVILYNQKRYIPYFFGGHQGYYTDLAPIPGYDALEIVLEFLCLLTLVLNWVFYQQLYDELDDNVPLLFNSKGVAFEYGDKLILYALPAMDTFFFVILTILQMITNRFRYDLQVTPENCRLVFQTTRKLILIFKLITMALFIFLTIGAIRVINDELSGYVMAYSVMSILLYGVTYYIYTIFMAEI